MGNLINNRPRNGTDRPQQNTAAPGSRPRRAAATPTNATPAPELKPVDIVISGGPTDASLANILNDKVKSEGYTVFTNTLFTEDAARTVARMLVDTKLLIFILSNESATNSKCGDHVSLAYISNKPILLVSRKNKDDIMKTMGVGLKLTLDQLHWMICESDSPGDDFLTDFKSHVQQYQSPAVNESVEVTVEKPLESANLSHHRPLRMNTKLRAQSTLTDMPLVEPSDTFWDRNFGSNDTVPWFRFQQAFINEYDVQFKSLLDDTNIPWLLEEVLHTSIFGGAEEVSRDHFLQVRGDSPHKHAFWYAVRQIAVEKFNMKEVFNMQSTVRLTAVENLGKFQNPAVIEALLRLLGDDDPNIRAVAAISLGRTKVDDEIIIDQLIGLLKDSDRIVRQSACLSLGSLAAKKAIPHISNIWRNDFISVVRDAARTALEKMNVPEAQEVLKVTRVLEDEIKQLEGKIVQV